MKTKKKPKFWRCQICQKRVPTKGGYISACLLCKSHFCIGCMSLSSKCPVCRDTGIRTTKKQRQAEHDLIQRQIAEGCARRGHDGILRTADGKYKCTCGGRLMTRAELKRRDHSDVYRKPTPPLEMFFKRLFGWWFCERCNISAKVSWPKHGNKRPWLWSGRFCDVCFMYEPEAAEEREAHKGKKVDLSKVAGQHWSPLP